MNCKEFNIWIETETESGILSAENEISEHAISCSNCNKKLSALQHSIRYMLSQKSFDFSDIQSNEIIEKLYLLSQPNVLQNHNKDFKLSKLAVAAVIIFGMLTGAVAGGFLTSESSSEKTIWSDEFTMLSENSVSTAIVFD